MGVAVFSMSTSVIFIKISQLPIAVLTCMRLCLSAALLFPVMEVQRRKAVRTGHGPKPRWWLLGIVPGVIFCVHLTSWAMGARLTTSANATLAVNTAPLLLPFLLHWIAAEKVTRKEMLGTFVAFLGLIVLSAADAKFDQEHLKGDMICMVSMVLLAVYLALGRRIVPTLPSPWLYTVPLYLTAGLLALPFALAKGEFAMLGSANPNAWKEWGCLFALAVVPTLLGHNLSMVALRVLRGQLVAVMSLGQFITAGLLAWMVFGEVPHAPFYVAAVLVVTGCAMAIFSKPVPTIPPADQN